MLAKSSRRQLLRTASAGAGCLLLRNSLSARTYQANEKLSIALVGVGGRGTWFVDTIPKMENVVAFCDVDSRKIDEAFQRGEDGSRKLAASPHDWERRAAQDYRRALEKKPRTFGDFRRMLEQMGKSIDAVIVATPDHTHAVATAAALHAGKPVFCEKPLTRTPEESRRLRDLARRQKVATSMGNQGTATGPFRRALELIRGGTIGEIREVHIWNSDGGSDQKQPPQGRPSAPTYLHWDLWLGPAKDRPYHPDWMQRNRWRDFGTCQLGNWGSHTANLAFMALKVNDLWLPRPEGKPVIRVQARTSGLNRISFPKWELIEWQIPARGEFGPIAFKWYNGAAPGRAEIVEALRAEAREPDRGAIDFAGALIVGSKGRIHSTGHNASFRLLPAKDFEGIQRDRPEKVTASRGQEEDWFAACRGGPPPWAAFDYASALNEFLMLGNVATRFDAALEFDPVALKITNHAEADAAMRPSYREGWTL